MYNLHQRHTHFYQTQNHYRRNQICRFIFSFKYTYRYISINLTHIYSFGGNSTLLCELNRLFDLPFEKIFLSYFVYKQDFTRWLEGSTLLFVCFSVCLFLWEMGQHLTVGIPYYIHHGTYTGLSTMLVTPKEHSLILKKHALC